jgi:hypothetical protein
MAEVVSSEAVARRLEELGLALDPEIQFHLPTVFPTISGWGAKGRIKRKHQLIVRVQDRLKQALRPGEEVLYVARGVQYKFSEQYFMGIWANLINQTVFVLTNLRLLMFQADTKGRPRHTFWMIYYSQIKTFQATWTGNVLLYLRDGTKLRFTGFTKVARKEMPRIFEQTLQSYRELGFNPEVTQSRENLCSFCMQVVPRDEYRCPHCTAEFWHPGDVAVRSLIFPPWGDFLLRHWGLAVVKLVAFGFIWLGFIAVLTDVARKPPELLGTLLVFLFILAAEHGVAALLTYYIAKKGLHPKKGPEAIPPADAEDGEGVDAPA